VWFVYFAANTCSCPNGTATVATAGGDMTTLCEMDGNTDCSACDEGYAMSDTAATGAQTCAGMFGVSPALLVLAIVVLLICLFRTTTINSNDY
jgi:hypothetical protein